MNSNAQSLTEYKASNGVTYHIKDTVKIAQGSGNDGWFVYLLPSAINTSTTIRDWMKRKLTNTGLAIKSIDETEKGGIKRYEFKLAGGVLYNFYLNVEEAIASCEINPCKKTPTATVSKLDELKKLKELLDSGAITQSEYDIEKKKILN